jgi:hypothetical protein
VLDGGYGVRLDEESTGPESGVKCVLFKSQDLECRLLKKRIRVKHSPQEIMLKSDIGVTFSLRSCFKREILVVKEKLKFRKLKVDFSSSRDMSKAWRKVILNLVV